MIPLNLPPREWRRKDLISVTIPSRGRCEQLKKSLYSLRSKAARPDLIEVLVAHDPDDQATRLAAFEMNADVIWEAPERYGYARSAYYWAALIDQAHGEWVLPTWSDDGFMETTAWDVTVREQPAGSILYTDGNYPGLTCFPIIHMDVFEALGRLCPLPAIDTWYEDVGRAAGRLVQPGIYVRQDRHDINGENFDLTAIEGGMAWRQANSGGMVYYTEPYNTWRAEDAATLVKERS